MNAARRRREAVQKFLDGLMTDEVKEAVQAEWLESYTNELLYGFDVEYGDRIQRLAALALRSTSVPPEGSGHT